MEIKINLNDKEYKALQELSKAMDLPEEKILIQGLRLYQCISLGKYQLREINPLPKMNPNIIYHEQ